MGVDLIDLAIVVDLAMQATLTSRKKILLIHLVAHYADHVQEDGFKAQHQHCCTLESSLTCRDMLYK